VNAMSIGKMGMSNVKELFLWKTARDLGGGLICSILIYSDLWLV